MSTPASPSDDHDSSVDDSPVADPTENSTGRFGGYALLAEIARGGMATVFLCRRSGEAGFQRLFALKVMHEHLADEEEFVSMLLDEARIAARVHHPNAVGIVDIGESGGGYYLVMDYVEGCSLWQLVRRSKEWRPPECIVPIIVDSLRGLHAAHTLVDDDGTSLNLIHRDVSPQNILVGVDGVARITDFGIAKAEARLSSTRPGVHKGKLQYMSPEQLKGKTLTTRSDLFSMGVVLWEALTGERLFRGDDDASTIYHIIHKEVPAPSTVGLRPPEALDAVVLKALERDPDARFASAAEMGAALRKAAIAADLLGSASDVEQWVQTIYGSKLEERRKAIASQSDGRMALVRRGKLALPQVTGSFPTLSSMTPSAPLQRSVLGEDPDGAEHPSRSSAVLALPSDADDKGRTPRAPWIALGVVSAVAIVLGLVLGLSGGETDREPVVGAAPSEAVATGEQQGAVEESAPDRAPEPTAEPTAAAAPEQLAEAPSPPPAASADDTEAEPATPAAPRRAARRPRPRPAARRPGPRRTAQDAPTSPDPAAPASTTPRSTIEANPYLRHN